MSMSDEEPSSPRHPLKLLCSYGGKILPRPSDGQLKYVGGETRVLSVPRTISYQELKKRIEGMFHAEVAIKYQLLPADLDALVSVTCDEDLHHMVDEYDRHDPRSPTATPRFRLFLFPRHLPSRPRSPDYRRHYTDAINGNLAPVTPTAAGPSIFTLSSANSSPTSTVDTAAANSIAAAAAAAAASGGRGKGGLHRVWSTPNLSVSGNQFGNGGGLSSSHGHHHHHHHQQLPSPMAAYAPWRMGGPVTCGCGCGCRVVVPPTQTVRGFYYPPAAKGGGGCVCSGYMDEPPGLPPRSAQQGLPHSAATTPRKSVIWE